MRLPQSETAGLDTKNHMSLCCYTQSALHDSTMDFQTLKSLTVSMSGSGSGFGFVHTLGTVSSGLLLFNYITVIKTNISLWFCIIHPKKMLLTKITSWKLRTLESTQCFNNQSRWSDLSLTETEGRISLWRTSNTRCCKDILSILTCSLGLWQERRKQLDCFFKKRKIFYSFCK